MYMEVMLSDFMRRSLLQTHEYLLYHLIYTNVFRAMFFAPKHQYSAQTKY
jgi:hypothetical protein